MTKVQRSADCKNSPKNAFAENVAVYLLTKDTGLLTPCLTEDAVLEFVGERTLEGRPALLGVVESGLEPNLQELRIDHALTHGRVGAVNGRVVSGGPEKGFCFILEFASTKADRVQQIRFYYP